jgi:hypothetical protein
MAGIRITQAGGKIKRFVSGGKHGAGVVEISKAPGLQAGGTCPNYRRRARQGLQRKNRPGSLFEAPRRVVG